MPLSKEKNLYFRNLDGLRTIACLAVILGHTIRWLIKLLPFPKLVKEFILCFTSSEFGVQLFFTLSGFLITYLIFDEINRCGKLNVLKFYLRRILRIWPLYFVIIFLGFVIIPLLTCTTCSFCFDNGFIRNLFFLGNFDRLYLESSIGTSNTLPLLNVLWSVSIEEQFYAFWPLIFFLIPKRFYFYILLLVVVLTLGFILINYKNDKIIYFHTFSNMIYLSMGGFIAYVCYYVKGFVQSIRKTNKILLLTIYIVGFIALMYFDELYVFEKISAILLESLFFSFIIVEQNFCDNSIFKFSNFKLLTHLGKYTYSMYLNHGIVIFLINFVLLKLGMKLTGVTQNVLMMLAVLVLTVLLSKLTYRFVEKYFLQLKSKY